MSSQEIQEKIYLNKADLSKVSLSLSSLDRLTAFRIIKDYILSDFRKKKDLHEHLEMTCTKMYISKSNAVPKNISIYHSSNKKNIPSVITYEQNPEFLNELDSSDPKEIFLEYELIERVIEKCIRDFDKAVLFWHIFRKTKLSFHEKKLGAYQKELDSISSDQRRDLRDDAIYALIENIKIVQDRR